MFGDLFLFPLTTSRVHPELHPSLPMCDQSLSPQMFGDVYFTLPHDLTSQFHARDAEYGHGVYMYQLDHRGNNSFSEAMLRTNMTIDVKCESAPVNMLITYKLTCFFI